jgi:cytochrome c biogenesis protein CcmG, thiol:disulfide interchange protein DsbE
MPMPRHRKIRRSRAATVAERRGVLAALACTALGAAPHSVAQAQAASIVAPLLDGGTFSTERIRGRVLLVNFWATWCAPCRAEMPEIEAYYQAHRDAGFDVLALSVDELADEPKVREAARPFSFAVAMAKASRLSGFGRIWRMPVCAVFDREGRLVRQDWFIQPRLDAAALDAVIGPLL